MKGMLKWIFLLILITGNGMLYGKEFSLPAGKIFHFDFSGKQKLEYKNGAAVRNRGLHLDGINDFVKIPGSGKIHFAQKGMTLAATLKMDYDPQSKKINDRVDMFFSKGKEFIFGRSGNKLYFNFFDGKSWCATTYTPDGVVPAPGTWAHVAATVEYVNDSAQGDVGYRVSIYLNGEKQISKKYLYTKPVLVPDQIEIGRGFGGGPWFMKGTFANVSIYGRPLNAAEIAKLCAREPRVKVIRKGFVSVRKELQDLGNALMKDSSGSAKWFTCCVLRTAANGYDQTKLIQLLRKITPYKNMPPVQFTDNVTKVFPACRFIRNGDLLAAILTGEGTGTYPVIGVQNLRTGKDIFGERILAFEIAYRKGKKSGVISSWQSFLRWKSILKGNTLTIRWTGSKPFAFTADSTVTFKKSRMESTFFVRNGSDLVFESVKYPAWSFAHLGGKDKLVHPYMSGVLVDNPTEEQFIHGQAGRFPCGSVTMQFGAYYNGAGNGIYFGFEDGLARTKNYVVEGKRSNLNVSWTHPVIADKGKNNSTIHGKAVVELYQGSWFEAGQIYRRFLEKDSVWWIKDLPRKSTPEWFRNNTLWILFNTGTKQEGEDILDTFAYLRGYFDLPFGGHWYKWSDDAYMGWPHYPLRDFVLKLNCEMRKLGVRTVPYVDNRLWKVKDGPGKTDYMYKSHGLKYAVKSVTGGVFQEKYGVDDLYTIMCPAAKDWMNVMDRLIRRVESYGFDGVYHDQVATGRPRLCYDRSHGHLLNDSSVWLEKGFWPMFDKFFSYLHKKNRSFCHTTEENSDPYLKQFDGYMVWRWTDNGQIPLFQSIYSGRAQFVGRLFNHSRPGERQSFFSKIGQQLVNSEQLGWFTPSEVRLPDERRLFVKKAMHLRQALLYYFNEGRMLKPMTFTDMKMERPLWGGNAPQRVEMPVIANSAWLGKDGSKMRLFVNTQYKSASEATPVVKEKGGFWICREGALAPVYSTSAQKVKLAPLASEVWISGSKQRAGEIQKILRKIASFDKGRSIHTVLKFSRKHSVAVPGKFYTVKDRSGNLYCNPAANDSHIGWIQDGAMIFYGTMDFGTAGAGTLSVNVAVDKAYAGGTLQLLTTAPGKAEVIAAEIPLHSTGSWNNYQFKTVALKNVLKGKQLVAFRILGNAACNFKGWKYSQK